MEEKLLKDLKKGEFFTRKPIENPKETQVLIRGKYDRASKRYEAIHFSDVWFCGLLKGETKVYTGFTF